MFSLGLLHLLQSVYKQLFHGRFQQVKQGFLVNCSRFEQVECQLPQVLCKNGTVAMRVHLDHKVFSELFGNKRQAFRIFEVRIVIRLHALEIQRSQFF